MDYFAIWLALRVCRRQNCLYWEDSWEVIETSKTRNGNLLKYTIPLEESVGDRCGLW